MDIPIFICLAIYVAPRPSPRSARTWSLLIRGGAAESNAVGLGLQSALVGALQDAFPYCLSDCRKDGHHHQSHRSFSSDAVVQEANGNTVLIELLDQPDHVNSVASQTVEFPDQDHIAIFHLQLQRVFVLFQPQNFKNRT